MAAGIALGVLLLMMSGRPADAVVLPSTIPQTVAPVMTTLGDAPANLSGPLATVVPTAANAVGTSTLPAAASTVSSVSTDLLNGATKAVQSLGGPNTLLGSVPALIPALPVSSSPAPALLGGIEGQGLRTTPTLSSRTLSAPTVDAVSGTGSAAFSHGTSTHSVLVVGPAWPLDPQRSPRLPSVPELLLATAGTSSGSGAHNGPLDSLPPTILVLALLVAAGMGLEHRRRPRARFDLRFSPPG
jgi:hypothetical protein